MKSVEDFDVFKLAHQLALKTYSTTFREFSKRRSITTNNGMKLLSFKEAGKRLSLPILLR